MKLKPNEYKKNYIRYILECVEVDGDEKPITNDIDKVNYIVSRFYDELSDDAKVKVKRRCFKVFIKEIEAEMNKRREK